MNEYNNNYNDVFISSIAKSELLTNIGKELNTPLNVITGMISMLENTTLGSEQKDYLNMIKSSSLLLTDLVQDILHVTEIDTGHIQLEQTSFFLEEITRELQQQMNIKADQKDLELHIRVDEMIPKELIGDPIRFKQVLYNLISNGIKYTSQGFVQVDIRLNSGVDNVIELSCSVEDSGIGISEDRIRKVFSSSSGLGLVISKILVELMGGSISVSSREGEGTQFSFTCKFNKTPAVHSEVKDSSEELTIDLEIFDKDLLLKKLNNNTELYNKIVNVFFKETTEKIEELRKSVQSLDFDNIVSISHSIKGAAGNITASVVQECAKRLEFAGKERESTNIDVLFDELSNEFYKLKEKDINIL